MKYNNRKKGIDISVLGLLIYVCLSATGLTLIKIGLNHDSTLVLNKSSLILQLNWLLILGMIMYVMSFLTSILVIKEMNLSLFYPLSAGLVYIIVCLLSKVVVKESIGISQMIGMAIIFVGIIIMNLGKGR